MNEEEEFQFRHRLEQEQATAVVATPQPQQPDWKASDLITGPTEAGMALGSGMAGGVASGLMGIATGGDPQAMQDVAQGTTYQPQSRGGQALTSAIQWPFQKLAEGADLVGKQVTDDPRLALTAVAPPLGLASYLTGQDMQLPPKVKAGLGAAANVAVQSIPALIGSKGAAAIRGSAAENAAVNSVKNATMREGANAGYKIPPSEMAQSALSKTILQQAENVGGRKALQEDISSINAKTVTNATRNDLGIPDTGQISEAELDAVKAPHFAVYDEAAAVSQKAEQAVKEWRQANYEAKRQQNHFNRTADPAAEDKAIAARQDAKEKMQIIESEAAAAGNPYLVTRLRAARVALGKIGTVEKALNNATGEVSANSLRKSKENGVPLDGGMAQAAKMSAAFKNKLTQDSVVQPGVSRTDAVIGAIGSALKGPKGLALTGVPYLTRRILLSRALQNAVKPAENITPISAAEQMHRALIAELLQQQQTGN